MWQDNIKKLYKTNSIVSIIVTIAIVILINIIAVSLFFRFDLTQNKDYSLSSSSKEILKNLEEKVSINVYFSSKLPSEYLSLKQNVTDLLSEYENYGKGNVKVNFIDPQDNTKLKEELRQKGIPELQFNVMDNDKYQVTTGYLGMSVNYLDKEEVIPVVESTGNFEYKVTAAIKKVSSQKQSKIAWAEIASADQTATDNYAQVVQQLQQDYSIMRIDITNGAVLDDSYSALIVAGVTQELNDQSRYTIDQFLMKGKSVLFLVDGVAVDKSLQATENKTGLDDMLSSYGVNLKKQIVLDSQNETANFSGGYMTFMVPYPFWVKVSQAGMDKNNPITSELESLVMPWPSYLEVNNDKSANKQITNLLKSTSKSWLSGTTYNLDPQQQFNPTQYGQYTLGMSVVGQFDSFYKDKETPSITGNTAEKINNTDSGRLVVIADADFITDNFAAQYTDNYLFFSNVLDWLNQDESLIAIRSKGVTDRPIKELSDSSKAAIKYGNIFGLTALVIIIGMTRFIVRKKKIGKIKIKLS